MGRLCRQDTSGSTGRRSKPAHAQERPARAASRITRIAGDPRRFRKDRSFLAQRSGGIDSGDSPGGHDGRRQSHRQNHNDHAAQCRRVVDANAV